MTLDEQLNAIRDIIQVDIGERGLACDPERNLINAFPEDFAKSCRCIGEQEAPRIAVLTGFYIVGAEPPCGETDGPLGAVYLARAFRSLGLEVELVADSFCVNALRVGLQEAGLANAVAIRVLAEKTWSSFTHLVSIERVGPASDGRCYSMRGRDISDFMDPVMPLLESCRERAVATIGIGDGGNEIGMGKIPVETIERNIPNGRQIACRVPTDHLIVAGISNWGAYALAAGVGLVRGDKLDAALFHTELECRILQRMIEEGPLVDGKTADRSLTVDGIGFIEYIRPLVAIRDMTGIQA